MCHGLLIHMDICTHSNVYRILKGRDHVKLQEVSQESRADTEAEHWAGMGAGWGGAPLT